VTVWQEEIGERAQRMRVAPGAGSNTTGMSTRRSRHGRHDEFVRDPAETVLLAYTAAFSGRPSAAMLSHTALVTQSLVMSRAADIGPSTCT
jgi:hypothetical protein